MDTIFALASAPGRSGVAVFRVSGLAAGDVLKALTGGLLPPARVATRAAYCDPESHGVIDQGDIAIALQTCNLNWHGVLS